MRATFLLLLTVLTMAKNVHAQELEVQPLSSTVEIVTDAIQLYFSVDNKTDKPIDINSVDVALPPSLSQGVRTLTCDKEAVDLGPKESTKIACEAPRLPLSQKPNLLFFRHKDHPVEVKLAYTIRDASRAQKTSTGSIPLRPLSPWSGVFIGGIIGVVILISFRLLYEKFRNLKPGSDRAPLWVNLLLGILVVALTSFLFRYTSVKQPDLPISIEIKDFIGGLVLGLAFEPLATWLGRLLTPTPTPASSPATPATPKL